MYKVLFVCTGNICRSPTAEGVFRELARRAGITEKLQIDSAGTHGYHEGEPPDSRSIITAKQNGIDLSGQTARRLRLDDFTEFDLILAMSQSHYDFMDRIRPEGSKAELALFLNFLPGFEHQDVPDPWFGHEDGFQHVFDLVHSGCEVLLEHVMTAQSGKLR
ncbi:MAG: low molecular weight phosphotyrosine protein phosphatase [Pseudomonadota bacterium]|jgi:protein-tyrosine phosphatase|nr:low molecular weight phosphotyrosine protein phosphatase [Pseudomonadota bacterium]QKK05731.1 MAG: low molecular weight phosphotyrosine protein phosphatase [Pseudomonadota bacterium]|tara:strand:+ start:842 stop:1327 length:486 start_codon:yes stop_codon:yes gene_type:complete